MKEDVKPEEAFDVDNQDDEVSNDSEEVVEEKVEELEEAETFEL